MAYQYFTLVSCASGAPAALLGAAMCLPSTQWWNTQRWVPTWQPPAIPCSCLDQPSLRPAQPNPPTHPPHPQGVVVWDLIIAGNGALAGLVAITGA